WSKSRTTGPAWTRISFGIGCSNLFSPPRQAGAWASALIRLASTYTRWAERSLSAACLERAPCSRSNCRWHTPARRLRRSTNWGRRHERATALLDDRRGRYRPQEPVALELRGLRRGDGRRPKVRARAAAPPPAVGSVAGSGSASRCEWHHRGIRHHRGHPAG